MRRQVRLNNRSAGVIFLALGAGLFVILGAVAIVLLVGQAERSDWPHTDGTVVQVDTHVDRDRRNGRWTETLMYTPQVEFAVDGQTYRFTSNLSTSDPWTVGETVEVVYNPQDPAEASIAGSGALLPWMLGGMAILVGVVFGGVGVKMLQSSNKKGTSTRPSSA